MNSLVCIKRVSTWLETGGGGVIVTDNCKTATTITCKQKPNRQACATGRFFKHINIHLLCLFMNSEAYWVVQEHSVFMRQRKWMQIRVLGERFLLTGFVFVSAPPTGSCGTSPLKVFRHLWFRLDISLSSLSQKRWITVQWTMQNVQHLQGGTTCLWVQQKLTCNQQIRAIRG